MFDETDLFFRMIQKFDKLYVFILSVSFLSVITLLLFTQNLKIVYYENDCKNLYLNKKQPPMAFFFVTITFHSCSSFLF